MQQLITTYRQRAESFDREAAGLNARYNRLALVRLTVFLAAILVTIYLWSVHWLVLVGFLFVFIFGFYRFVRWHLRIQKEAEHRERLARINAFEAVAAERLFPEERLWSDGAVFVDPDHPYSLDIDLFGPFSFFHYINRASTAVGRNRLADYLSAGVSATEIHARQAAVGELRGLLDWRQHFQAYGLDTKDQISQIDLMKQWLADPSFVTSNRWLRVALVITPIWMTAGLALWFFVYPWQILLPFAALPAWILWRTRDEVDRTHLRTSHADKTLQHYARLISYIESAGFGGEKLQGMRQVFHPEGQPASIHLRRLSYLISQLNVRYNVFAIFLNLFALWDLHWVLRLERWREAHRQALPAWFDALAEMEALVSFATAWHNNPDWTLPVLSDRAVFRGEGLGHPLILASRRVVNDLAMPAHSHIKLITGSNMAGKSTFLRTAGLAIVLAMAGAPVCARRLELPLLEVYTSMRTQDALHESTSSFYAELKRLKFIIENVERPGGRQIFFLLDEILKGTNSRDRHAGSKALIRQLIQRGGSGLIATHDLELGLLEAQYGGAIENLCMEVEIRHEELYFDYVLKPGVSQSFNATLLMRNMGIKVENNE